MTADLTCPTCKGAAWLTRDERLERGSDGLACPDCIDGRRLPELHEWDALQAERDQLREARNRLEIALHTIAYSSSTRDLVAARLVAREALNQDPCMCEQEGHRTVGCPEHGREHRAALDSEDSTMITDEEAIRDAEAALEDHYAYGSDDG